MSTKQSTIDYLLGQINTAGEVSARKMFGEYGVYCDGRVIALVCDDQLFLKPTQAGKEYLGDVEVAPPYPGGKDWFLIPEDQWEDAAWLTELIRLMTPEIPLPAKKKGKK
ncbi:MAG TPA: TfoX/Sxy family protein [Candidatus Cloacimonadota bacterium]|nr:TfoX/Sxy family protein [Candidatus Cloacimonadota bacterium]